MMISKWETVSRGGSHAAGLLAWEPALLGDSQVLIVGNTS